MTYCIEFILVVGSSVVVFFIFSIRLLLWLPNKLNWEEVKLMIDEYYAYDCHCDCHILQAIECAGIQKNRRFIGGMWRYESFPDECYEILSKP